MIFLLNICVKSNVYIFHISATETVFALINALTAGDFCRYKVSDFAAAGVARISLGSSLARATHNVILTASRTMFADGDFSPLLTAADGDEVDKLLAEGAGGEGV